MKYPRDFIDKVKQATDIVELVSEFVELKKAGRYLWNGKCPNPKHDDDTASFIVNAKTQSWCCYGCHSGKKYIDNNYGSDSIAFIQWINEGKLSWAESFEFLAKRANIPLIKTQADAKKLEQNKKLNDKYRRDMDNDTKQYCINRGLDNYDIAKFELGYDSIRNRLTFPLYNTSGDIVGFNKRALSVTEKAKYMNSENSSIFCKSTYLYNLNNIDKSYDYVFITEGVFDVILATKYGLKNVICTLGCAFSEVHYLAIKTLGLTPVLLYDNDLKGQQAIRSVADFLYNKGIYPMLYILPQDYDLADFALENKYNTVNLVCNNISTYGFIKAQDIVKQYLNDLYLLKARYRPQVSDVINTIPEQEKEDIQLFLTEEIRM